MSQPISASDIAATLLRLSRQLDEVTEHLATFEEEAAIAKHEAEVAETAEFLRADGAVEVRKAKARHATQAERLAAELAAVRVRNGVRARDTIKVRIDVGRSANAGLRAEVALAGAS